MSQEDKDAKSEPMRITVPAWLPDLLKIGAGVVISVTAMYIRVALLESRVEDSSARQVKAEALIEVQRGTSETHNNRITTLETRQSFMDKSITESLGRIERDLGDVKRDVKDLQIKPVK